MHVTFATIFSNRIFSLLFNSIKYTNEQTNERPTLPSIYVDYTKKKCMQNEIRMQVRADKIKMMMMHTNQVHLNYGESFMLSFRHVFFVCDVCSTFLRIFPCDALAGVLYGKNQ